MSNKEHWDSIFEKGMMFKPLGEREVDAIIESTGHPTTALDIASGTGDLLLKLARRGITVTGVDISDVARRKAGEAFDVAGLQATLIEGDFNEADFASKLGGPYELVLMRAAFAFVHDKDSLLEQVKKVLAPGGAFVCILTGLLPGGVYDERQLRISLPKEQLEATLKRNFTSVELLNEDTSVQADWPQLTYVCR